MSWTTPEEIREQVAAMWNRGRLLSARMPGMSGGSCYPLRLRLRKPAVAELAARFDDVRAWIRALEAGSKAARGFGYEIVWRERRHRELGRNRVPSSVSVDSERDALRLIGREKDAEAFRAQVVVTVEEFPQLASWLGRYPLLALEHSADWERVLAVLRWFRDHPRSGLYLRQLDIAGVDSKFMETRLGLLAQLLDRVLPGESIETAFTGARQFEARYGLRSKPALVRFRVLDDRWRVGGFSDVTVTTSEFSHMDVGVRRVFVTENETNGLTFRSRTPPMSRALVR